jgi:hypothetical protein
MNDVACSMGPMVEAKRDQRLAPRDRAALERHITSCVSCRALERDLDTLAALARQGSWGALGSFAYRRRRQVLLSTASQAVLQAADQPRHEGVGLCRAPALSSPMEDAPRRWGARVGWAFAAAVLLVSVGVAFSHTGAPREARASTVPAIEVHADPVPAAASAAASAAQPGLGEVAPPEARPAPPPRRPASERRATASSPDAGTPKHLGTSFADGVAALGRGDNARAAEQLGSFAAANPGDARAEDAAFLVVVAHQRAGRRDDAIRAASGYLERYPNGYRSEEARRVLAALQL